LGITAYFRFKPDRKGPPIFPDRFHHAIGWTTFTLAIINVMAGLYIIDKGFSNLMIADIALGAVIYLVFIGVAVFFFVKHFRSSNNKVQSIEMEIK
jgi:hypothetical protein